MLTFHWNSLPLHHSSNFPIKTQKTQRKHILLFETDHMAILYSGVVKLERSVTSIMETSIKTNLVWYSTLQKNMNQRYQDDFCGIWVDPMLTANWEYKPSLYCKYNVIFYAHEICMMDVANIYIETVEFKRNSIFGITFFLSWGPYLGIFSK